MVWLTKPPLGTQLDWTHPLNTGLAGFWVFNEGMGNIVNDLSGNNNTGTLTNMAFPSTTTSGWNPGPLGDVITFDGINDFIDVGSGPSLNNPGNVTVGMKINIAALAATQGLLSSGRANSKDEQYGIWVISGQVRYYSGNGTLSNGIQMSPPPSTGKWEHILFVRNGIEVQWYLNGAINLSTNLTYIPINTLANSILIGCMTPVPNFPFNGAIDEIRIWNRALTIDEVQAVYNYPYEMFLEEGGCPPITCSLNVM